MARLSSDPAGLADLHVHTTASDGTLSPAGVVQLAVQAGLAAIAIADHDSVDAVDEAVAAALEHELWVIPAVEINTECGAGEAHILGYFIQPADRWFRDFLARQRAAREGRAQRMVERLAELGYQVEWGRVLELAAGAVVTRPHVARALVEKGYIADVTAALTGLLATSGPAYVPRGKLSPHDAVVAVRRAGGVAVLAHPGTGGHDELIDELIESGLAGIEAYHPQHSRAQQDWYARRGDSRGLVVTGGSDFHGSDGPGSSAIGDCAVPVSIIGQLLARLPVAG